MKRINLGFSLLLTFILVTVISVKAQQTQSYTLTATTGTFSSDQVDCFETATWTINTSTSQVIHISGEVNLGPYGHISIYQYDNAGNPVFFYSTGGANTFDIQTENANGKAMIEIVMDYAMNAGSGFYDCAGFGISYNAVTINTIPTGFQPNGDAIIGGNVGIGVLNPLAKLHVNGPVMGGETGGALRVNTSQGNVILGRTGTYDITTDRDYFLFDKVIRTSTGKVGSTWDLSLQTAGTTRMTLLNSNGFVGIGTATPGQALTVKGNLSLSPSGTTAVETNKGSLMITKPAASGQYINLSRSGNASWSIGTVYNTNTFAIGQGNATDASFTAPPFVINSLGHVGIGTIDPTSSYRLNVNGPMMSGFHYVAMGASASPMQGIVVDCSSFSTNENAQNSTFFKLRDLGANWTVFNIRGDGKVGIGLEAPQNKLDIAATNGDGIRIGKVGDTGTLTVGIDSIATRYNIDFSGYRDIELNQVGARISAVRYNNHLANSALVQKTGLSFSTNPTGLYPGTTGLVERMTILPNGNVGIGTSRPAYKLDVAGTIRAAEVKIVSINNFADFVFEKNYKLPTLNDVHSYIQENGHLPNIPSAQEVKENGINLVEMQVKLLQKVEELTLYALDQQKRIEDQQKRIDELEKSLK